MERALYALSILAGAVIVAYALQTAIRTFLLPQPGLSLLRRSWVTVAEAVLDAAALAVSTFDPPGDAAAERCLETGSQALRKILDGVWQPLPGYEPASHVTRSQFEAAYGAFAAAGLPLVRDQATAWSAFTQWRRQYEPAVRALLRLTQSPPASWPSAGTTAQPRP